MPIRPDHLELHLERVDMLLLILEDVLEKLAADVVAHRFAMVDGVAEQRDRFQLQLQVGLQDFLHRFADAQAPEQLEIGETFKEQDAVGELVRMLISSIDSSYSNFASLPTPQFFSIR